MNGKNNKLESLFIDNTVTLDSLESITELTDVLGLLVKAETAAKRVARIKAFIFPIIRLQ
jgi:hypothetical protein